MGESSKKIKKWERERGLPATDENQYCPQSKANASSTFSFRETGVNPPGISMADIPAIDWEVSKITIFSHSVLWRTSGGLCPLLRCDPANHFWACFPPRLFKMSVGKHNIRHDYGIGNRTPVIELHHLLTPGPDSCSSDTLSGSFNG